VVLKLFHKIEREGMLSHSFYESSISLIPKSKKDINKKKKKRKVWANFLDEYRCKNSQ
jgi:hypothetical protein